MTSGLMPRVRCFIVIFLAWALNGCAISKSTNVPATPTTAAVSLARPIEAGAFLASFTTELEPASPIRGRELLATGTGQGTYRIPTAAASAPAVPFTVTIDPQGHRQFNVENIRISQSQLAEDGSVITMQELAKDEDARVVYPQGSVMLPAHLSMEQPFTAQVPVEIRTLSTDALREQGHSQFTIKLLGKRQVTTPAGTFEAYIVHTHRVISLRLAQVTIDLHSGFVPGQGLLVEHLSRQVKVFGLGGSPAIETLELQDWQLSESPR